MLIIIHNRMRHLRLHISFSFQAESTFFLVLGFLKYTGWLFLIEREAPQPSFFLSLYLMSSIAYCSRVENYGLAAKIDLLFALH